MQKAKTMKKPYRFTSIIDYKSLYHSGALLLGVAFFLLFSLYSFVLIDPNITLINNQVWVVARELLVHFGYYQRQLSTIVYSIGILGLVVFYMYAVKHAEKLPFRTLLIIVCFCGVISYPFLSHDFFNYMFDARILTIYHQSPYIHKALDFPADEWLRFMHWTHRTYPYGPTFLALSLVPSFLGFGKFFPTYLLFKFFNVLLFAIASILLYRLNKKWGVLFTFHPLIFIEGLINSHNDMIALSLGMIGFYFLLKQKTFKGILFLIISTGIKFMTAAYLPFLVKKPLGKILGICAIFCVLIYTSFFMEVQSWYFLIGLGLIPFMSFIVEDAMWFVCGLLLSYIPYILNGIWDPQEIFQKHVIMAIGFCITVLYFFMRRRVFFLRLISHLLLQAL